MLEMQDKRTWTKEIKEALMQNNDFERVIKKYKIVGYHYTNLLKIQDILNNGIKVLNNNTIDIIKENLLYTYPNKSKKIVIAIDNYLKNNGYDNRENLLFFCCDNKQINNGFNYIFDYYGGEIIFNCLNSTLDVELLKVGNPYIIKFIYNYKDLAEYKKAELKGQMRKKLLNNEKVDMDFAIKKDILPDQIIGFYEVKKKNKKYYISKFVEI